MSKPKPITPAPEHCPHAERDYSTFNGESDYRLLHTIARLGYGHGVRLSVFLCPECSDKAGREIIHWCLSDEPGRQLAYHILGYRAVESGHEPAIEVLQTAEMYKWRLHQSKAIEKADAIVKAGVAAVERDGYDKAED